MLCNQFGTQTYTFIYLQDGKYISTLFAWHKKRWCVKRVGLLCHQHGLDNQ